jgi:hypothetical protein
MSAAPSSAAPDRAGPAGSFFVSLAVAMGTLLAIEAAYRGSPVDQRLRRGANYVTAKGLEYDKLGGDIVVTGDSRMFHGVIPRVMQQTLAAKTGATYTTFNYGIPSGTTPIFLMAASAAAHHRPPPRVFVIGVTPALFSCCDTVSNVGTAPGVTPPAVPGLFRAAVWANPEEAGAAVAYGASRVLAFRTEISAAYRDVALPKDFVFQDRGWNSMGGRVAPSTQDTRAKGRAAAYAVLMDKSKGAELHALPGRFLAEAIEELQRAGVKVAVIGTPQARQLDWYHDAAHTYFEYLAEVKRVTSEHGVPFVDLNAPPGIASTDFVDGDHLSEPGATIFTRDLAELVVLPLLR